MGDVMKEFAKEKSSPIVTMLLFAFLSASSAIATALIQIIF
jgi:hypothetical protein